MTEVKNRHRAREIALQVLFQKEFVPEVKTESSLNYFRTHLDAPEESWAYAAQVLAGVEEYRPEIDKLITDKSKNWKIARMSPVDLSALRIATFEICFHKNSVPPKVAIDEAIELVKRYGSTDSSGFVNGVLDEIYREHRK